MRDYELTVILSGSLKELELEKETKSLKDLLAKAGAKIKKELDAAKKVFVYEIAKNKDGYYLYYELEIKPEGISALDNKLKLSGNILRYLLVRKGE